MNVPVLLHGAIATHRRGRVLQEALSATPATDLPSERAVVISFADDFQLAAPREQSRLIEWTRASGHLLLLLPPFASQMCQRPVSWSAERFEFAPRGGEGLAKVLAPEVAYHLTGHLQAPALPGATWSDLSQCVGSYRLHPAAGLFAVTCLPLWSLAVLEVPRELESWLAGLLSLAGDVRVEPAQTSVALRSEHYGLLVFLLSQMFANEDHAIATLRASSIFSFSSERARELLKELRERGLIIGASPTTEAHELVMRSPYAPYVSAVREASR